MMIHTVSVIGQMFHPGKCASAIIYYSYSYGLMELSKSICQLPLLVLPHLRPLYSLWSFMVQLFISNP